MSSMLEISILKFDEPAPRDGKKGCARESARWKGSCGTDGFEYDGWVIAGRISRLRYPIFESDGAGENWQTWTERSNSLRDRCGAAGVTIIFYKEPMPELLHLQLQHCSNCDGTNAQPELWCVVHLRILYIAVYSKKHWDVSRQPDQSTFSLSGLAQYLPGMDLSTATLHVSPHIDGLY